MNIWHALILGIVQGLTEFLPISSSGHLIIFPSVFGWGIQPLAFDTTLHLGTALALVVYFWKDLLNILMKDRKLGFLILAGSVPAAVVGLLLENTVETVFRDVSYVILFLLAGSLLMFIAEKLGRWRQNKEVTMKSSILIGVFQSLALLPGISRSGSTISGGMLFGLNREKAARFSFLLSMPIVVAAGFFKVVDSVSVLNAVPLAFLIAGFLSSFVVGMLAIRFMLNFLQTKSLNVFIIYRVLLSISLLIMFYKI
ncbi:undecaprenyl-diphosphatase UppP [candidate division WWE3 bacterium RIFCSPHIGHO2_01_FULL_42_13]|uniref:Undecaprenyl-diphosphatase n=1 Tax=candidate division WWE3 bacterium RIFCSPHIGHO2_01_FULL_42_13 TaxID=1802617 RepID=A0A1F4UQR2_UNCKA|nr:MAG: undecaprenyl-diphosphatase UppP [candidate division WWE3 bacterium RIFCSPHIGHO2_01_FULL_42_13]